MPLRTMFLTMMVLTFLLESCAPAYERHLSSYRADTSRTAPDYSDLYCWAAHPWKKDPSDSVPLPLRGGYAINSTVDVFFLHPTTLTSMKDPRWNADIGD